MTRLVIAQTFDGNPPLTRARSSRVALMGCSLHESIPWGLDRGGNDGAAVSVGEGSGIEDSKPSLSSRQEVRSCGRLLVSLSPSLPVWHAAGGRGGSRAGQATFGRCACRMRRCGRLDACPPLDPRPSPTPGLAGLPSRSAKPPSRSAQRPHPPTQQQPGRYAAALLRCISSPTTSQACAWLNGSGSAAAFFFASSPHKHTRPALLPLV